MRALSISLTMMGLGIILHWVFLGKGIEIVKIAPIFLILGMVFQRR